MDRTESGFPRAPEGWSRNDALRIARDEAIAMGDDHWDVVRALHDYFARHASDPGFKARVLHDALEEKFHHKGGLRFLYTLFPGGPVAQGCRIAGLKVPWLAVDRNFGSVM